jgi:hypothetical protein
METGSGAVFRMVLPRTYFISDLCGAQDDGKQVLGTLPQMLECYIINEAHKRYSLLDSNSWLVVLFSISK